MILTTDPRIAMLFGIDTSGKIGEGNLFIATVKHENTDVMDKLREMIAKRHRGLSGRRRIKASSLNHKELAFAAANIKSQYGGAVLTISDLSEVRKSVCNIRDWKIKSLAAAVFLSARKIVRNGDVVLVDRDYSEDVMRNLLAYLKTIFASEGKNIAVESGTSFNDVIAKADLIAGCLRKSVIKPGKIQAKDVIKLVGRL